MDREKVISALHCVAYDDEFPCWKCAYYKQDEKPVARCNYRGLMDDTIELLKWQDEEIKRLKKELHDFSDLFGMLSAKTEKAIAEQPQIVRCKDCKHWEQSNGHCPFNSIFTNAEWFCADGERRGDSG